MKRTCCLSVGRIIMQTLKTLDPVLSECCKVGYSATLARAHVHRFICSENRCLPSLGDLCREFIAKDHKYYLSVVQ